MEKENGEARLTVQQPFPEGDRYGCVVGADLRVCPSVAQG